MLDQAQWEPVCIQRHHRDVAVLISADEFTRLHRDRWAEFNRLSGIPIVLLFQGVRKRP